MSGRGANEAVLTGGGAPASVEEKKTLSEGTVPRGDAGDRGGRAFSCARKALDKEWHYGKSSKQDKANNVNIT